MSLPNPLSLWAAAAPYDSSCMDSRSMESPRPQTPTNRQILGHHNHDSDQHHSKSTRPTHTITSPFPEFALSPIAHTNDPPPMHMNIQQPPTQHMYESHNSMHKWIRQHTQQLIHNVTHSIHTQSHMNDSHIQHTPHNHNTSHSFTFMNDTYLVVHNHPQDNSF